MIRVPQIFSATIDGSTTQRNSDTTVNAYVVNVHRQLQPQFLIQLGGKASHQGGGPVTDPELSTTEVYYRCFAGAVPSILANPAVWHLEIHVQV
jgi:hypothetical protein